MSHYFNIIYYLMSTIKKYKGLEDDSMDTEEN